MTEYRERARARAVAAGVSASPFVGHNVAHQAPSLDSLMRDYGLTNEMDITTHENANDQTIEQEFQSFVSAPLSPKGTSTLKFWEVCEAKRSVNLFDHSEKQSSQSMHLTLFEISLDYLPIQASTVPSERAFSSSAETDTKKRNRINSTLMEALQMLKFAIKKARLDFTSGWITSEREMQDEVPEEDLLATLLEGNREHALDKIIQAFGQDDSDCDDDDN
jgi:hAT family C-terminal dimerisation region